MPADGLLIRAEGLSKSFGSVIFSDISFTLGRSEALGVMGGNGSGKTTLLNILAGLDGQTSGKLDVNCKIGYVMQKAGFLTRLSCADNMRYACALHGIKKNAAKRRIMECAEQCGVTGFLKKKAGLCSGGMAQRLNIALALLNDPDALLLDEAAANLDDASREALRGILNVFVSGGGSVIMVSHYKEELSVICPRALRMETGSIDAVYI